MTIKIKKIKFTDGQLLWLSLLLLILLVEATYVIKFEGKKQVQAHNIRTFELNVSP